ncbi:MAG TPA: nickel pincer cofactor biosynthesis protein LarB [Candidatus Limnocylindria bacterium]|jgi:NCAIR mutase (PurE)-related protein|nr:nickel pincer cofactor biosynthesis protein LarB [Candidatus Limnocylindria bacterium]
MNPDEARTMLEKLCQQEISVDEALRAFQVAPISDLGFAAVDLHRTLRKGFPEVIYGQGKTPAQVAAIGARIAEAGGRVLVTRVTQKHAQSFQKRFPHAIHHEDARCLTLEDSPLPKHPGYIAVVAAGTSDLPVAEEAAVTAEFMGNRVERIYDVGVAGLHRLLRRIDAIQAANVIIAVAGMEAALPTVIGGLVSRPLIGVPTSVGYGAHLGGVTALLGMLNSCASGMTVVNIDNGFGAGYAASSINALAQSAGPATRMTKAARKRK